MPIDASEKFDKQGNLKDPQTEQKIKELLEALVEWTRQLKKARA
jgi:hypothetical protein